MKSWSKAGKNYQHLWGLSLYRISHPEVFRRKDVHKNCAKFTGKHLRWSLFLIKLQALGNYGDCFCFYFWLFWCSMQMEKTVAAFLSILRSNVLTPWTMLFQSFSHLRCHFPCHNYLAAILYIPAPQNDINERNLVYWLKDSILLSFLFHHYLSYAKPFMVFAILWLYLKFKRSNS